jgi:hypothetical protein
MRTATYCDSVARQREDIPGVYGDVDFSVVPERLDVGAIRDDPRFARHQEAVDRVFDQPELLERMRNYTMTGDRVADRYAALIPEHGFRALVEKLDAACERGVEKVDDAPPELVAFIRSMENTPDWVDMDLVEQGARGERVPMATATPFAIRGAFLATFLNKYAALPMTKVRLMHSMVRFHLMGSGRWDVATFGIPIPQVDQMPAGTIGTFFLSARVLANGRTEFTPDERATVELARYRCFLLGLPEDLLGDTPQEIVDLLTARHITLREGYDDEICGSLVRGTMDVELFDRTSIRGRVHAWLEDGFSRFVLVRSFLGGDSERAASIGIDFDRRHKVAAAFAALVVFGNSTFYKVGLRLPVVSGSIDRRLNAKLAHLLDSYGHADFVTDPEKYQVGVA